MFLSCTFYFVRSGLTYNVKLTTYNLLLATHHFEVQKGYNYERKKGRGNSATHQRNG